MNKPTRRWFQFSLRTLLIGVTLCALACSWLALIRQRKQQERQAVAAIRKLNGRVLYDLQIDAHGNQLTNGKPPKESWLRYILGEADDFDATVHSVNFDETPYPIFAPEQGDHNSSVADTALENLKDLGQVRWLYLRRSTITDAGMVHIQGLEQLRGLSVAGTKITDAGLKHLEGFHKLQCLELVGTHFSDVGIEHLKGLNQIEWLELSSPGITDSGLAHLAGLSHLTTLYLSSTQITDAGLEHLKRLKQLKELHLDRTQVTPEGLAALKLALPNCTFAH